MIAVNKLILTNTYCVRALLNVLFASLHLNFVHDNVEYYSEHVKV